MTLIVGTDSYATLAEANTYATERAWSAWSSASDSVKEAALKDAASYIDLTYAWNGSITSTSQAMSWPRTGVTDKEGRTLDSAIVPERVKQAQIELANIAVSNAGQVIQNQSERSISRVQAGSVSVSFDGDAVVREEDRFKSIDRLLAGLYTHRDDADDDFNFVFQSVG